MDKLQHQQCETCDGSGSILDQRRTPTTCPTCSGRGQSSSWAGVWWSVTHEINDLSILERQLERVFRLMWNGLIVVFAGAGIFLGVRELLGAAQHAQFATTLISQSWIMAALWFGLLSLCFLIYRLVRENGESIPAVPVAQSRPHAWAQTHDLWDVLSPTTKTVLERAWHVAQFDGDRWVTSTHIIQSLVEVPTIASMIVRL